MPVVLATMHGAHGVGELTGAVRYGPPWSALAMAAGLTEIGDALEPPPEAVYAPSLR